MCSIRLDFETFTLAGPATTGEENGGLCTDTFIATVSKKVNMCYNMGSVASKVKIPRTFLGEVGKTVNEPKHL